MNRKPNRGKKQRELGASPWARPSSVGRRLGRPRRGALGLGDLALGRRSLALQTKRAAVNARSRGRGVLLLLDAEVEEEGAAAQNLGGRRRAALGIRRCREGRDGPDLGGPEADERFLVEA